jgi:hypothetical protein
MRNLTSRKNDNPTAQAVDDFDKKFNIDCNFSTASGGAMSMC